MSPYVHGTVTRVRHCVTMTMVASLGVTIGYCSSVVLQYDYTTKMNTGIMVRILSSVAVKQEIMYYVTITLLALLKV